MAYVPVYESRINWQNYPSENTPIDEQNLNKMDYALFEHDKSFAQIFNNSIKRIDYNTTTKAFLFTYWDGHTEEVNLALEQIPAEFSMDADGVVHMIDDQGNEYTADLKDHIYYIEDFEIVDEGTATATTFTRKNIVVNNVSSYEIPGTKHMSQTVVSQSTDPFVVTFTNSDITTDNLYDVYVSVDNLNYDEMSIVNGRCDITYSEYVGSVTVDLYIK